MASKGLSGAAPVLEEYGLSCEHDLLLLVQEDLNALSSQLWNVSSACSMPLLERIRDVPLGTTLSWQYSRSTTNAISELLLFCVCDVCDEIHIYICPLLPRRARCVCALWI